MVPNESGIKVGPGVERGLESKQKGIAMTSAAANSAGQPRSRREMAFLSELPEDFLRVDVSHRSTGGQTSYR